jgi:transcriptional repressor NrdR
VLESRPAEAGATIRRRRECSQCGHRFTTYERYEQSLFVRKRSGRREPFDRAKLRSGLVRAAHKRPVPEVEIDQLVDRITTTLETAGGELPARRIGEMCLEGLRRLDRISYLQFAAVYKELSDIDEVGAELARLQSELPVEGDSAFDPTPVLARPDGDGSVRAAGESA